MAAIPSEKDDGAEKVSILLVDDRPDKLLSLRVLLDELHENVVCAGSGKEALRCLLHQDFAVILLDVNMPVMDGFETAALIRQRQRSEATPIIFVSAVNDTENHVTRGYSLGAVDYILAPVVPEILRAKVAAFVDLFRKTELVKKQAEERGEYLREQARRAEAEAAQERLAFLADASNVLAGSLEYHQTFENLARLVVPRLADFCIIDTAEENGVLRQVAVAHRDPKEETKLRSLSQNYPTDLKQRHGGTRVFQSGKSEFCCKITDEVLRDMFEHEKDRSVIRSLGPVSYLATPLIARGGVLGAITMVNTSATRPCGPNELSLAEELAQRAALALDNARLYKAAQKARVEAERANQAKDQFLAMLSHELRTPLMPVLTTVLSLDADDQVPAALRPSLQMIRRNVELEARLIDDLLDLTRISKGKVQLNLEIVDAHTLLKNALEICAPDIREKRLVVQENFEATQFHLHADPARLQQIFWNLVKNAVKFTPERGHLAVSTSNSDDEEFRVSVQDSGLGIEPEFLPKIFDAFEQGERMRFGGLGLGLAITKALVDLHHGRIKAESDGRDRGAKFTLAFPSVAPDRVAEPASQVPGWTAAERKYMRILLVEDHEDSNRSLTQLLRRRGYQVRSAFDVKSALEFVSGEEFDVLVSDMGLPDGSGLDIMRNLTAAERPIYGIALSGFGMESDIRKSHAAGFHHHLIKPVDLNKLDAVIQQVAVQVPAA